MICVEVRLSSEATVCRLDLCESQSLFGCRWNVAAMTPDDCGLVITSRFDVYEFWTCVTGKLLLASGCKSYCPARRCRMIPDARSLCSLQHSLSKILLYNLAVHPCCVWLWGLWLLWAIDVRMYYIVQCLSYFNVYVTERFGLGIVSVALPAGLYHDIPTALEVLECLKVVGVADVMKNWMWRRMGQYG